MVQLAQAELGQAEQPPGSNDSPRIAEYRTATAGGQRGPWCAYFVSWAAKQAGAPVGEQGQGFGAVSAVMDWGQRTGRALPAGSTPQPGDIIVWGGRHIGIVEAVLPDGRIQTIEGNSSDKVSRRTYGPDGGGATGLRPPRLNVQSAERLTSRRTLGMQGRQGVAPGPSTPRHQGVDRWPFAFRTTSRRSAHTVVSSTRPPAWPSRWSVCRLASGSTAVAMTPPGSVSPSGCGSGPWPRPGSAQHPGRHLARPDR